MLKNGVGTRISCALTLALASVAAQAQMGHHVLVHPKAAALGNAVTADPPGIFAIRRNPAGLTRLEGRQMEFAAGIVDTVFEATFEAPEGCNIFGIDCAENDPVVGQRSYSDTGANYIPGIGMAEGRPGAGPAPLGAMFSVQRPGSKITFGNGAWVESSGGFVRDEDDPGRYQPTAAAIQRLTYFAPTAAYKINDNWSVGAGINFSHHGIAARQVSRAPNMLLGVGQIMQDAFGCDESAQEPLAPWLALCGGKVGPYEEVAVLEFDMQETLSPSYTIGVLWEPTDWFTWGANYTSGASMNLKGTYSMNYSDDWVGFWQAFNGSVLGAIAAGILTLPSGVPVEAGNISAKVDYPQTFSTGISARVLPFLTLNMDVDYVDLAVEDYLPLKFDRELEFLNAARILSPDKATPSSLKMERAFKDIWNFGYGATFHASERLDLRAGVQFRGDVVPSDKKSLMAPIGEMTMYGAGFGYQWSKDTSIDVGVNFMKGTESIPADSSCNINCNNITNLVYNPYAGLDVTHTTTIRTLTIAYRTKF